MQLKFHHISSQISSSFNFNCQGIHKHEHLDQFVSQVISGMRINKDTAQTPIM